MDNDTWNLLEGCQYKRAYQKIEFQEIKKYDKSISMKFTFKRQSCDLLHKVDIYFPNTGRKLNEFLNSIEVEYGGDRVDKIFSTADVRETWKVKREGDIETMLNTNASILGSKRKVVYTDKYVIVPLHMAPFHDSNLVFPGTEYHELSICICGDFLEGIEMPVMPVIYAECYYVDEEKRKSLVETPHEFLTIQNKMFVNSKSNVMKKGTNTYLLNLRNPVYGMYFWGFDKSKVTNITLKMNEDGPVFYDGGIEPLEYHKTSRGIDADPLMIFFADTVKSHSAIDFNKLHNPVLIIESEQEEETTFYLIGLNTAKCRYDTKMFGLS